MRNLHPLAQITYENRDKPIELDRKTGLTTYVLKKSYSKLPKLSANRKPAKHNFQIKRKNISSNIRFRRKIPRPKEAIRRQKQRPTSPIKTQRPKIPIRRQTPPLVTDSSFRVSKRYPATGWTVR